MWQGEGSFGVMSVVLLCLLVGQVFISVPATDLIFRLYLA